MKQYNDLNKELEKNKKTIMKDTPAAVFGKSMENVEKHRDIKLVKIDTRRSYSVSKSTIKQKIGFQKIYWKLK